MRGAPIELKDGRGHSRVPRSERDRCAERGRNHGSRKGADRRDGKNAVCAALPLPPPPSSPSSP